VAEGNPPGDLPTGPQGGLEPYFMAWAATGDGILRGLNHALSNRILTLRTLTEFVGSAHERRDQVGRALGEEVERLEELLEKFRMLPAEDERKPEPIQLSELLSEVVELHQYHVDFRDLECRVIGNPDALPVLTSRSALTRALLILLTAAKRAALSRGETTVAMRHGGGDDHHRGRRVGRGIDDRDRGVAAIRAARRVRPARRGTIPVAGGDADRGASQGAR
jgi:signal transduction histidine kinase